MSLNLDNCSNTNVGGILREFWGNPGKSCILDRSSLGPIGLKCALNDIQYGVKPLTLTHSSNDIHKR